MANLPALREPGVPSLTPEERQVAQAVFSGMKTGEIARKLAPHDKVEQRRIRARVRKMCAADPVFQAYIGEMAHGQMVMGLGIATRGLVRAAGRGRTEAIKLLFEATGFHVQKAHHEHSGEVKLTLNIPRPPVLDDEGRPEKVVDAEVVEDGGTG